jgi:hypothetical protein
MQAQIHAWSGDEIPEWCADVNGERSKIHSFLPKLLNNGFLAAGRLLPQIQTLCTLKADLSGLRGSLKQLEGPAGTYYKVSVEVVIKFGGTQLQATMQWKEGVRMRIIMDIKYHSSRNTGKALRRPRYHHSKCDSLNGNFGERRVSFLNISKPVAVNYLRVSLKHKYQ